MLFVELRNTAFELRGGRYEGPIDDVDLRRMDCEHARKTILPGIRCIRCQTFEVAEIRKHRIYCRYFCSGRRKQT